ncbi:MAG TPA: hypothetical protein PKI62_10055 [bacterium]|nr:hypothetical protein [bacterium]HPR89191.1 hypothetical protein [bacterium]
MSRLPQIFTLLLLAGFCLLFCHSELHLEHCGQTDHHTAHDYCQLVKAARVAWPHSLQKYSQFQWIGLSLSLSSCSTHYAELPAEIARGAILQPAIRMNLPLCQPPLRI